VKVPFEHVEPDANERAIRSLSERSGVGLLQVRTLFRTELARVGMGAKISSYLAVLTASNVRGMLRRMTRLAEAAQVQERNAALAAREPVSAFRDAEPLAKDRGLHGQDGRLGKRELQRRLHSWEDDGGSVLRAA
jgi:hypothetical protein